MTVNGIGQNVSLPRQTEKMDTSRINDTESTGIQNRITDAQQQLQRLSSDKELTAEEKKQKRQEVQKEIADLNRELRQRQMELRRKQIEKQEEEEKGEKPWEENRTGELTGTAKISETEKKEDAAKDRERMRQKEERQMPFPQKNEAAMLAAAEAKDQAGAQRQVVISLEGTARITQSEIDQDARRGQNTERKEEALKATEERAARAASAQMGLLSNAAKDIRQFGTQNDPKADQQNEDEKIAAVIGAPQSDYTQNAIQRYNAGKMYSSVTFHV